MIPKTIHYCWFGGNPKSEIIERCIASWKAYCPDYEIIEWNESNFDVHGTPYTAAAYAAGKWAFVSDYARLQVVHDHGGIYLDTDVLLHHSLDELLQYDCWFAQEDLLYVSTGLGFGARKNHPVLREMMRTYENSEFVGATNGEMDMQVLNRLLPNWVRSEYSQLVNDIFIIGMKEYGRYARHLATISWTSKNQQEKRKKEIQASLGISKEDKYQRFFSLMGYRVKCFVRNPKIIQHFTENPDSPFRKVYLFLAYDFLDYGPVHFAKQICSRLTKKN